MPVILSPNVCYSVQIHVVNHLKKNFKTYIYKLWLGEEALKFRAPEWELKFLDSESES